MSLWDDAAEAAPVLTARIVEFVRDYRGELPTKAIEPKIIHDAVHGTQTLDGWEIAILDTPLLQRLRHIQQTSHAYLTYPSARHDRFQHSLGVRMGAERILRQLSLRQADEVPAEHRIHVQLAALVHDCGHGFGSHISEEVYGTDAELQALRRLGFLLKSSPHERLSCLIVLSPPFVELVDCLRQLYGLPPIDMELVGRFIVGAVEDPTLLFLGEIINGPFDADKMDYFLRDSHFTGIPLAVDMERLLSFIQVEELNPTTDVEEVTGDIELERSLRARGRDRAEKHLVLGVRGVTAVEQMVFNRFVLTSSVYQHHKVRSADVLMVRLVEELRRTDERIDGHSLNDVVSFLELADAQVWFNGCRGDVGSELTRRLRFRELPKRSLVLSRTSVANAHSIFHSTAPSGSNPASKENRLAVEEAIWEEAKKAAGKDFPQAMVWFDVPKGPQYSDARRCFVRHRRGKYSMLSELAKVAELQESFDRFKYRAHVFTVPPFRQVVADAAKHVLEDLYEVRILPSAFDEAKL